MTANELLTKIQLFGEKVHSNNEYLKKIENEHFNFNKQKLVDHIKASNNRMPTDYQNSYFYDIIENSFSVLKETIDSTEIKFCNRIIQPKPVPLFGTANFNEFNAFVETTDNVSVIVFNEGLLKFMERLKEIYIKEHWLIAHKEINPHLRKVFTKNFVDIILSFYLFSDAYYAIPLEWCDITNLNDLDCPDKIYEFSSPFENYFWDDEYLQCEYEMTTSIYLWIAAHEYAHVALGHLEDSHSTSKLHLNGIEIDKIDLNQQQELDADLLGAIITMESKSSFFCAYGIYFALICLLLSEIDKKSPCEHDYPLVRVRMKNIFDNLNFNKDYLIGNYHNIDKIFAPKYEMLRKILCKIDSDNISFSSVDEMQEYVYKIYSF